MKKTAKERPLERPFTDGHLAAGGQLPKTTDAARKRAAENATKSLRFKKSKVVITDPWGRTGDNR